MEIERQRQLLEEVQTIESQIALRVQRNPEIVETESTVVFNGAFKKRGHKEVLLQQLEIRRLIGQYKKQKVALDKLETAANIKEELQDKELTLTKFDEQLEQIKNHDNMDVVEPLSKHYEMKSSGINILSQFASDIRLSSIFSPGEYFGKYLDLVDFHQQWLNLSEEKLGYVKYLEVFYDFKSQNIQQSKSNEFFTYLKQLYNYLVEFIQKSRPLFNIEDFLHTSKQQFQLEQHHDPLFCTTCDKLFAKQTVYDAHITGKKHQKNQKSQSTQRSSQEALLLQHQIHKITIEILNSVRQSTKLNTERRTALTEREKEIEIDNYAKEEDEELVMPSSDEEEDNKQTDRDSNELMFNPMNLPLGPDGQPIPFWLYKLHGLGIEFTCEICGGFAYMGRKSFESHFGEHRHTNGLRCLGIEPSSLFKDITKIEDAKTLWVSLMKQKKLQEKEKEEAIEVEDSEGNVMSQSVYNELKKQGLV